MDKPSNNLTVDLTELSLEQLKLIVSVEMPSELKVCRILNKKDIINLVFPRNIRRHNYVVTQELMDEILKLGPLTHPRRR